MKSRNFLSKIVRQYQLEQTDKNFDPIWEILEPKIKYIANRKSKTTLLNEDDIYEILVESLVLSINKYKYNKNEFSTFFYTCSNRKILDKIRETNRYKRRTSANCISLNELDKEDMGNSSFINNNSLNPEMQFLENNFDDEEAKKYLLANKMISILQKS